ncbi:hypothetical protein [Flavobacterium pectinovorum]|uniref:SMODS and SLOG-associating 2TM effector domain-containing protein n=1 Tax=Flavobacterium pectinovorum TaxID=29533 RepID=A0AB36P2V8_9FLAO|nr:hypothetical protein [Flavobacterium pectinovorum]OXB04661.1 hypothetical protein B0A72_11830 [Flavobacterium pectinovorum]SHL25957.1 hypothetical protein SAMN05444387_0160 [Flavobacterium pectinovorum]
MTKINTQIEVDKLYEKYDTVHYFWRDKVLTQLGISINLFLTIGIAVIGYYLTQNNASDIIVLEKVNDNIIYNVKKANDGSLHWSTITMLILFLVSVFCGCMAITSRLHDLRITSKTFKLRKIGMKDYNETLPDEFPIDEKELLNNYWKATLIAMYGYKEYDFSNFKKLEKSFLKLRSLTEQLGKLTWILHMSQIIVFILGIIAFFVSYFIN